MENSNKLKQFPLLITLIIGMTGWLINYLVANVKDKPIVEYSIEQKLFKNEIHYVYTFENISSKAVYKELKIIFDSKSRCDEKSRHGQSIKNFYFHNLRFLCLQDIKEDKTDSKIKELLLKKFQPGNKLEVFVWIPIKSKIKLTYTCNDSILFTEPSLETFFIKNETIVFSTLLFIYLMIMFFYLLINYKKF